MGYGEQGPHCRYSGVTSVLNLNYNSEVNLSVFIWCHFIFCFTTFEEKILYILLKSSKVVILILVSVVFDMFHLKFTRRNRWDGGHPSGVRQMNFFFVNGKQQCYCGTKWESMVYTVLSITAALHKLLPMKRITMFTVLSFILKNEENKKSSSHIFLQVNCSWDRGWNERTVCDSEDLTEDLPLRSQQLCDVAVKLLNC